MRQFPWKPNEHNGFAVVPRRCVGLEEGKGCRTQCCISTVELLPAGSVACSPAAEMGFRFKLHVGGSAMSPSDIVIITPCKCVA